MAALRTDTAAQAAIGAQISDTAMTVKSINGMIENDVMGLQADLVGSAGTATQAKAQRLMEVLIKISNDTNVIGEKVNAASGSYVNSDESGAGTINASAGQAF